MDAAVRRHKTALLVVLLAVLLGTVARHTAARTRFGVSGGVIELRNPRLGTERVLLTVKFDAYQGPITIDPGDLMIFDRARQLSYPSTRAASFVVPGKTRATEELEFDARAANGNISRELDVVLRGERLALHFLKHRR